MTERPIIMCEQWRAFGATFKCVDSRDKQCVHAVADGCRKLHDWTTSTEGIRVDLRFQARHAFARIAVAFCDWDMVSAGQDGSATRPPQREHRLVVMWVASQVNLLATPTEGGRKRVWD